MNLDKYNECIKGEDNINANDIYFECQCENNKNKCECMLIIKNYSSIDNKIIDVIIGEPFFDCCCDSESECECDTNCNCECVTCHCYESVKCQCNCIICKDCREFMQNNIY